MSHLRTFFLKLLVSSAALLACACSSFVVDAGAAPSKARTHKAHRSASHRSASRRSATHKGHRRISRKGRRSASHKGHRRISRAARNRSGRLVRHTPAARRHTASGNVAGAKSTHNSRSATVGLASQDSATIANVLATPCENTELTPTAQNIEAIDAATLCLVNQERARNNELPLQPNAQLEQAAQAHSEEMVSDNYFAHVAPSGLTPVGRVQETGYVPNQQVGYTLGENIAWGTLSLSTPAAIVAAWIASPEHLANILYSSYRDTAIGVSPAAPASLGEGQQGAVYSQDFGVIVG